MLKLGLLPNIWRNVYCFEQEADVQWASHQPDIFSLLFMCVCHIWLKIVCELYWTGIEGKVNCIGLPWGCFYNTRGRRKMGVGNLSRLETCLHVHTHVTKVICISFYHICIYHKDTWSFIFLCRLKINQIVELHFLRLFSELARSREVVIKTFAEKFFGAFEGKPSYILHGKVKNICLK
jgi:hypothetical protein